MLKQTAVVTSCPALDANLLPDSMLEDQPWFAARDLGALIAHDAEHFAQHRLDAEACARRDERLLDAADELGVNRVYTDEALEAALLLILEDEVARTSWSQRLAGVRQDRRNR